MGPEHWMEVELTVTDQANKKSTRTFEYNAQTGHPEAAGQEVINHIRQAVGNERIHAAGPERSGEGPGLG